VEDSNENVKNQDSESAEAAPEAVVPKTPVAGESDLVEQTNFGNDGSEENTSPSPFDPTGGFEDTHISLDFSGLPDNGGFDTIGFDYNPEDLEKTPASGTALAQFSMSKDEAPGDTPASGTPLPPPSTASQLAQVMAEFGFNVPEREPDWEELQTGLIGIDFGSSDAVVSCYNEDGRAVILENSINRRTTPARLLRDENNEWIIGIEAKNLAPALPDQDYGDLKSLFLFEGWSTVLDGEQYSAKRLLSIFVKRLFEDINPDDFSTPPTHVALAAPVWFQPQQREALADAVKDALGLEVVGVTDELLAACVPYSLRLPDLSPRKAVVVDVGHKGTSCAFIECVSGDLNILCEAGLPTLGGINWDELLIAESVRKFTEHYGFDPRVDASCMTDLNLRVEEAKKALSSRKQCNMLLQSEGKTLKVRFTREAFEKASTNLIRTMRAFLNKILEQSTMEKWEDFDALVVTGGGVRIPMVKNVIEEALGRSAEAFNAEENVAIGTLYWGVSARHLALQEKDEKEA
jgi:actin-like ATPase involved in cell morphogenesis